MALSLSTQPEHALEQDFAQLIASLAGGAGADGRASPPADARLLRLSRLQRLIRRRLAQRAVDAADAPPGRAPPSAEAGGASGAVAPLPERVSYGVARVQQVFRSRRLERRAAQSIMRFYRQRQRRYVAAASPYE